MKLFLYLADGPATKHTLICAPSLKELVAGIIQTSNPVGGKLAAANYLGSDRAQCGDMRRELAVEAARRAQDSEVQDAIRTGRFSTASATDAELARLNRQREHPDSGGAWPYSPRLRLFLVPADDRWIAPDGATIVGWRTDYELLRGLRACGEIAFTRIGKPVTSTQ